MVIIITDRVHSTREGYVLTRVCPSVFLSTPRGRYPGQVQPGGGYSSQVQAGGGVSQPGPARGWGTPARSRWGIPQPGPGGGYPSQVGPGRGVPWRGVPHLRYPPPSDLAQVGTPMGGDTPPSSTWYAAVGMPLAFTQEDFLVISHAFTFTTSMIFVIFTEVFFVEPC